MPPISGCGIMELAVSFYACYCEVCGYVKHLNNSANGSTIENGANGFRLVYFCFKCMNKKETANRVLYPIAGVNLPIEVRSLHLATGTLGEKAPGRYAHRPCAMHVGTTRLDYARLARKVCSTPSGSPSLTGYCGSRRNAFKTQAKD